MKLLIVGVGNMGGAIARALSGAAGEKDCALYVNDRDEAKAEALCAELPGASVAELGAAGEMDALLLAVKPDIMPALCRELSGLIRPDLLIISIAAGIKLAALRAAFPANPLCRAMPNLPVLVGEACTSLCFEGCGARETALAEAIFSRCGRCYSLPEGQIDAVVGLSGSGPAYCMLMLEALADGGVKMGLPRALAREMAVQTVKGSALLLERSGLSASEVKDRVCSPGGTTIAAVAALEEHAFRAALISAVEASALKNRELGRAHD